MHKMHLYNITVWQEYQPTHFQLSWISVSKLGLLTDAMQMSSFPCPIWHTYRYLADWSVPSPNQLSRLQTIKSTTQILLTLLTLLTYGRAPSPGAELAGEEGVVRRHAPKSVATPTDVLGPTVVPQSIKYPKPVIYVDRWLRAGGYKRQQIYGQNFDRNAVVNLKQSFLNNKLISIWSI